MKEIYFFANLNVVSRLTWPWRESIRLISVGGPKKAWCLDSIVFLSWKKPVNNVQTNDQTWASKPHLRTFLNELSLKLQVLFDNAATVRGSFINFTLI